MRLKCELKSVTLLTEIIPVAASSKFTVHEERIGMAGLERTLVFPDDAMNHPISPSQLLLSLLT